MSAIQPSLLGPRWVVFLGVGCTILVNKASDRDDLSSSIIMFEPMPLACACQAFHYAKGSVLLASNIILRCMAFKNSATHWSGLHCWFDDIDMD